MAEIDREEFEKLAAQVEDCEKEVLDLIGNTIMLAVLRFKTSLSAERKEKIGKAGYLGHLLGGMVGGAVSGVESQIGEKGLTGDFLCGFISFLTTAEDTDVETLVDLLTRLQTATREIWEKGVQEIQGQKKPGP